MHTLTTEEKISIEEFIGNNKAREYESGEYGPKKIKINRQKFDEFMDSTNDLTYFGSQGSTYDTMLFKHSNGNTYLVTYNMGQFDFYSNFTRNDL